jgi:very-short-patch-repair endonuclease
LKKGGTAADASTPSSPPFREGGRLGGIPAAPKTIPLNEYEHRLKPLATRLRSQQTEAEQKLWHYLRRDQLGIRFYRQRPLGSYILDFYAPKARLVVELDGSQHFDDPVQRGKDARRDAWLGEQGIKVMRFDDRQALLETQAVLEAIRRAVGDAAVAEIPPSPPLEKGGALKCPAERWPPLQNKGSEVSSLRPKGGQGGLQLPAPADDARE